MQMSVDQARLLLGVTRHAKAKEIKDLYTVSREKLEEQIAAYRFVIQSRKLGPKKPLLPEQSSLEQLEHKLERAMVQLEQLDLAYTVLKQSPKLVHQFEKLEMTSEQPKQPQQPKKRVVVINVPGCSQLVFNVLLFWAVVLGVLLALNHELRATYWQEFAMYLAVMVMMSLWTAIFPVSRS